MGKMSWLAYLIDNNMQKELREELTPVAKALNKPYDSVLDSFVKDHEGNYKKKPLFTSIKEIKAVNKIIKSSPEYKLGKRILDQTHNDAKS